MKSWKSLILAVCCLSLTFATGCGGGGGSSTHSGIPIMTISGSVIKGRVSFGTVSFYEPNPDGTVLRLIGSTTTNTNGGFSFNFGNYQDPLMIRVTAGTHRDELDGHTSAIEDHITDMVGEQFSTESLDCLVPALDGGHNDIQVTALTDMAATLALIQASEGLNIELAAQRANDAMSNYFGFDIVHVEPHNVFGLSGGDLPFDDRAEYTLVLAGLDIILRDMAQTFDTELGNDLFTTEAIETLFALQTDLVDRVFDSAVFNSPFTFQTGPESGDPNVASSEVVPVGYNYLADILANAMETWLESGQNNTGWTTVEADDFLDYIDSQDSDISDEVPGGGGGGVEPPEPTTIQGVVQKGPVANAVVTAMIPSSTWQTMTQVAQTTAAEDSSYSISLGYYEGPVVLVVTDGLYKDELLGDELDLGTYVTDVNDDDALRCVLPLVENGGNTAHITPVTDLASMFARTLTLSFLSFEESAERANTVFSDWFGFDIVETQPRDVYALNGGEAFAFDETAEYALVNAGLSRIATTSAYDLDVVLDEDPLTHAGISMFHLFGQDANDFFLDGDDASIFRYSGTGALIGNPEDDPDDWVGMDEGFGGTYPEDVGDGVADQIETFLASVLNQTGWDAGDAASILNRLRTNPTRFYDPNDWPPNN